MDWSWFPWVGGALLALCGGVVAEVIKSDRALASRLRGATNTVKAVGVALDALAVVLQRELEVRTEDRSWPVAAGLAREEIIASLDLLDAHHAHLAAEGSIDDYLAVRMLSNELRWACELPGSEGETRPHRKHDVENLLKDVEKAAGLATAAAEKLRSRVEALPPWA